MKGYSHQLLWKTSFQFVSHIRTQQGITDGQVSFMIKLYMYLEPSLNSKLIKDRLPVFDVRQETSLGFTIAKLLATKAHRVWVVDEHNQATGVVSLTDVIRTIASLVGVHVNERRASMAVFKR